MANYETYDQFGTRDTPHQLALEQFKRAHGEQLAKVETDLKRIIEKAKADAADVTIPQYKLECLRLADGDIKAATEMFAFLMGAGK